MTGITSNKGKLISGALVRSRFFALEGNETEAGAARRGSESAIVSRHAGGSGHAPAEALAEDVHQRRECAEAHSAAADPCELRPQLSASVTRPGWRVTHRRANAILEDPVHDVPRERK